MQLTAEVRDGGGAAHRWMGSHPIRLGFRPCRGTLNVHLTHPAAEPPEPAGTVEWFGLEIPWYRATVDGLPCVVLGIEPDMAADHKLELIAPDHLRSTLDVENGDTVTIRLEAP